jgi:hypothetical protein
MFIAHKEFTSRHLLNVEAIETQLEVTSSPPTEKNDSTAEVFGEDGVMDLAELNLTRDGFSRRSRKTFRIVTHVLVSCYCFWMLAIICDEYFIGSIEILCQSSFKTSFAF